MVGEDDTTHGCTRVLVTWRRRCLCAASGPEEKTANKSGTRSAERRQNGLGEPARTFSKYLYAKSTLSEMVLPPLIWISIRCAFFILRFLMSCTWVWQMARTTCATRKG